MTTYGCEVWKLKEKNKTKVKSHRDGLLEESAGKSRLERVTNKSEKYMGVTHIIIDEHSTCMVRAKMPKTRILK